MTTPSARRRPSLSVPLRERETVRPLELFFDLVFVLGFTQCTALMSDQPTWSGIGRAMLVLAMLWWAWVCFTWLTSAVEPEEGWVRLVMLGAMTALLVAALCVPESFGDRALTFAIAYGVVRAGHIGLFLLATRDSPTRRVVRRIAASTALAVPLLIGAAFLEGRAQVALWVVAILLDWGLPAIFGDDEWRLAPAHFAERHNLVIIIALGESIVALGAGAEADLTWKVIVAAALGLWLAAALWWTYFDVVALVTGRRLVLAPEGHARNRLARESYAYLHFPMVAGIVLGAFGLHEILAHPDEPLDSVHSFALLGGTAIYLLAHVALRLRNAHTINVERLVSAFVLFAVIPAAIHVDALVTIGALDVLLWAMIAYETFFVYDERRDRLRRGLEVDVPGADPG